MNYVTFTKQLPLGIQDPILIKKEESPEIIPKITVEPIQDNSVNNEDVIIGNSNYDISKSLEQLFADNGIAIKVTSGFRPNSKTAQGRTSNHSRKDQYGRSLAYDIKPLDGDWNKLKQAMVQNDEIRNYFEKRGLGVIDETIAANMAKTNATGKHFHIGPDQWAQDTWKKWLVQYSKKGNKLIPRGKSGIVIPSRDVKNRIANWEGSDIVNNTSHNQETIYWNQISPNLSKLNQQQQDVLYDSLYNATPSYRKLIIPVLKQYNPNNHDQWIDNIGKALNQFPSQGGLKSRVKWRINTWDTSHPFRSNIQIPLAGNETLE